MKTIVAMASAAMLALHAAPASAVLMPAFQMSGRVGLSVDGAGSNNASNSIQTFIPVGAVIERAFLYGAGIPTGLGGPSTLAQYNGAGITLGGASVSNFSMMVGATSTNPLVGQFRTARADVTTLIASLVAGSVNPNLSFAVTEGTLNTQIDGMVLAIAYSSPTLAEGSVIFLDGGQRADGETIGIGFASPIGDPNDPAFVAQLGLGISFSCCDQATTVDLNGQRLSNFAGGRNDGATDTNWSLITVGGLGDSGANNVASYADDDELYDLRPFLRAGDTSFSFSTRDATNSDNLFFASLYTTARASVTPPSVPEPATWAMLIAGFGLVGGAMRRSDARRDLRFYLD